ncbi:MAG: 5'-nucleotidase C-terminal domain-containing protein [Campylobacteraceae bacterium]|nr:5'-nucleotidase C-terminal domain-containing protein [Campylobacteraceae bacterium]
MILLNKHKLLTFLFFLLITFLCTSTFASNNLKIIFTASMTDISDDTHNSYARLATLLKEERKENPNTLFLFGGDSLGPSSMSSLDKGVHIIDILNSLEPDAVSVNKRELVFSPDQLTLRSFEAAFPFVTSNVYDQLTQSNIDGIYDSVLINKASIKIGIISVLNPNVIEEYGLKRISILDIEKSIRKQAKILRQKNSHYIILLPSSVFPLTQKLLDEGIINLSLDKNEHFSLEKNRDKSNDKKNILITEKGLISSITLSFNPRHDKVINFQSKFIKLNTYEKDEEMQKQIDRYQTRIDVLFREKIGVFLNSVNTKREIIRAKESIFGNLLADALKEYTGAQITLINGGAIRGETYYNKQHSIKRKDIVKELPFRNNVKLIQINGEQLLKALENGFSLIEKLKGRFPHISGIRVVYNKNLEVGKRVQSVFIQGQKLILSKKYTLATSDYLASGGDGYHMFRDSPELEYFNSKQRILSNILIDYIIKKRTIKINLEGRIKEVSNEK